MLSDRLRDPNRSCHHATLLPPHHGGLPHLLFRAFAADRIEWLYPGIIATVTATSLTALMSGLFFADSNATVDGYYPPSSDSTGKVKFSTRAGRNVSRPACSKPWRGTRPGE